MWTDSVAGDAYAAFQTNYFGAPSAFVQECVAWRKNEGITPYQVDILDALVARRRVSVRGLHGMGKTSLAAWAVLWFALTRDGRDWKVVTTASAWRQVTDYLWPEIRKWAHRLKWDKVGRRPFTANELLALNLKLSTGSAFAAVSDNPALIEGAHADHLFYVFDESKAIHADTFDAAEGAFSGGDGTEAFALSISTPGEPQGRFYDIQARKPGYEDWWTRHVTAEDAIAAGRVSRTWVDQRRTQWGEGSAVFQNRVLGEFASNAEDGIIPLAWVERANERWHAWREAGQPGDLTALGVDVGRGGDKTVIARRHGPVIARLERSGKADTMETVGIVAGIMQAHEHVQTVVDVIGIGAGVVDRLREQGLAHRVTAFNAAMQSTQRDRTGELGFVNKRAEAWWRLREMLDPMNGEVVALPPDDTLVGDLTAPHWRVMSGGRIAVESKDEMRSRLGRSTDDGDAVVMAFEEADNTPLLLW